MNGNHNESDWKRFRKIVPELRERYIEKKNSALLQILTDSDKTPTEQFWDIYNATRKEAKILRDCLDGHSRSKQFFFMVLMCNHGLIAREDLEGFSEDLQASLSEYLKD